MTPVAPQGIASTRRGYEWAVKSAADAAKDWRALLLPLEGEDSEDEGPSELGDEIDESFADGPGRAQPALYGNVADGDTAVGTAAPKRVWQRLDKEGLRAFRTSEHRIELSHAANRKRSHDFMDSLGGGAQPNV